LPWSVVNGVGLALVELTKILGVPVQQEKSAGQQPAAESSKRHQQQTLSAIHLEDLSVRLHQPVRRIRAPQVCFLLILFAFCNQSRACIAPQAHEWSVSQQILPTLRMFSFNPLEQSTRLVLVIASTFANIQWPCPTVIRCYHKASRL